MASFSTRGAFTALVTPFCEDSRQIDFETLEKVVEHQIKGGISGIFPVGTTGEAPTIEDEEQRQIIEFVAKCVKGRVPVIAGIGTNNTDDACKMARRAVGAGADAVMLVASYYNRPSQDGLFAHFRAVAASVETPLIAYNIPGRAGVRIEPETLARICESSKNVVAVKDATGNVTDCLAVKALLGDRIDVLSGDDALTVPMMSVGASGVISVTSNLYPAQVQAVVQAAAAGDYAKAKELSYALYPVHEAMFCYPSPGPIKTAMASRGLLTASLRLPMTLPPEATQQKIIAALNAFEGKS